MKNDFEKELNKIAKKIEEISNAHEYAFVDIFSKPFMLNYTNSSSIENFFVNSPFKIHSQEDFNSLPENTFDQYVYENTPFATWDEMHTKAVKTFLAEKLGL